MANSAIDLAELSTYFRSLASPAPNPFSFVGVLTEINTISDSAIDPFISVLKNKFLPLHSLIKSFNPGSYTGNFVKSLLFQDFILSLFKSTTITFKCLHLWAITAIVGPPTYPAPIQQIVFTLLGIKK